MLKVAILLCLTAVCYRRVTGASVRASYSPQPATEGLQPYTVRCSYTLDSGERFRNVELHRRLSGRNHEKVCSMMKVDISFDSMSPSEATDLQDRAAVCSGSVAEKRVEVRLPETRCSDADQVFVCYVEVGMNADADRTTVEANVSMVVEVLPQPPDPVTASSGGGQLAPQVTEGTEVAYTCSVNVGSPPAVITWFTSNTRTGPVTSVTNKAAFRPLRNRPNDVSCSERRESVLRLRLTCQQMGKTVYVRCLVDHPNKSLTPCTDPGRDFCRWGPTVAIKNCDYIPTIAPGAAQQGGQNPGGTAGGGGSSTGGGEGQDQYGDDYGNNDVPATPPAPRDRTTPNLQKTTADSGMWSLTLSLVILGVVLGTVGTVILVLLLVRRAQRVNRGAGSAGLSPEQQGVYTVSLQLQDDARTQYGRRSLNSGRTGDSGGSQYTASTGDTESVATDDTESVGTDATASEVDSNVDYNR